ncbi:MAG: DUF255 domain-containing protein [Campylobacterota bacterium]|nr:DUF255 domain-containing protein [Campylobacterota bacterium]
MFKILLLIAVLFATSVMADEIKWAKDFESGILQAQKENKPVLFVFSRHTCKYCVVLEKTTFSDANVIKGLNKDFVSIIAYSDENDAMPRELWRPGTPTIWFLKPNAEPMFQPLMGAVGKKNFLHAMSVVKKEFDEKYTNNKSGK